MKYFYYTRHGQTIWNVENKICGVSDVSLTEKGINQARELGNKILDENIHIDEILYSPLVRAKETALYISEITGIPVREESRLKEQAFGNMREHHVTAQISESQRGILSTAMTAVRQCFTLHSESTTS